MGTLYLLHFERPISERHTCQHYIGFTSGPLAARLKAHADGGGARLTQVARERGIGWQCVRTWKGGRADERKLKDRHDAPRLCPVCRAQKAQA